MSNRHGNNIGGVHVARVGLIAGIGILPVEFMRAAHLLGHEVVVIAVVSDYDTTLEQEADVFYHISVAKVGKIFKTLQKEQVKDITMLGKVTKELLFKGLTFPDMKTLSILNKLKNRKDDTIMLALVDELEKEGFTVVDQTTYLKPFMPAVGVLSKKQPTQEHRRRNDRRRRRGSPGPPSGGGPPRRVSDDSGAPSRCPRAPTTP